MPGCASKRHSRAHRNVSQRELLRGRLGRRDRTAATRSTLARALAGACIGVGALTADREATAVTEAAVRTEVHQALDVHGDFLAEVTLDLVLRVDDVTDLGDFRLRDV